MAARKTVKLNRYWHCFLTSRKHFVEKVHSWWLGCVRNTFSLLWSSQVKLAKKLFPPPLSISYQLCHNRPWTPTRSPREAKEAIHIQQLDPDINRNIGKMSIPHCFDPLISVKPKHPWVNHLSQLPGPEDELAPPSQIPGLNLTQFNNLRPNPYAHIPRQSTRACRARNLQN